MKSLLHKILPDFTKRPIIYGASENGRSITALLYKHGVNPLLFVDSYHYGVKFNDHDVISPTELLEKYNLESICIIIASAWAHEIYKFLLINGYKGHIYVLHSYLDGIDIDIVSNEDMSLFLEDTYRVHDNLHDDTSKEILNLLVDSRLNFSPIGYLKAFEKTIDISGDRQYFIHEVMKYLNKYDTVSIIDCGAYDGDTIQIAIDLKIPINNSYCFEPDEKSYIALIQRIAKLNLNKQVTAIRAGVWNESGIIKFLSTNNWSSRIIQNDSGITINMVSLDNYLSVHCINLIKMDIEGSEMNALKGALKIINQDRPILAISIYHNFYDLVKIPLFLMDILKQYNYFLRHHSGTQETVFYCIPQ